MRNDVTGTRLASKPQFLIPNSYFLIYSSIAGSSV
jgi:hypothetical protein